MYDPVKARGYALRDKYRMTILDFEEMLAAQDGRCAVCRATDPGGQGGFHVDHDHFCCPSDKTCGSCVRGLLCYSCNSLLARAKDDPKILASAIRYLKQGGYEA